jgi:hypothetical protein
MTPRAAAAEMWRRCDARRVLCECRRGIVVGRLDGKTKGLCGGTLTLDTTAPIAEKPGGVVESGAEAVGG